MNEKTIEAIKQIGNGLVSLGEALAMANAGEALAMANLYTTTGVNLFPALTATEEKAATEKKPKAKKVAVASAPEETVMSADDMVAGVIQYMAGNETRIAKVRELLKSYGVGKVRDIKASDRAEFLEKLQKEEPAAAPEPEIDFT